MANFREIRRIKGAGDIALELVQSRFPEYHPLTAIAELAHSQEARQDPKFALACHQTILPYVSAKLANVEHKIENGDDRSIVVSLFDDRVLEDGRTVQVEVPLITEVSEIVPLD